MVTEKFISNSAKKSIIFNQVKYHWIQSVVFAEDHFNFIWW